MYGQKSLLYYAGHSNFNFIYGDVRNEEIMKKALEGQNIIIPLASIVGAPACERRPHDAISINKEAIALLEKLRTPEQKVIYPVTNSGYGTKSGEIYCTEESSLEPISLYGKTKVEAEKILLGSSKPAITLRLATVFGVSPRMRTDLLLNDFVHQAVTNKSVVIFEGHFKRNFVHVIRLFFIFQYFSN